MKIRNEADLLRFLNATTREQAKRHIYKYTACGAWLAFNADSVQLGSIVEGSDAEVSTDPLRYPFQSKVFDDTINFIEREADRLWREANEGEQI
jgi:hypothetical protein